MEYFNRCLAAFLIGGIYCEAINLDGLDFGSIIDWKYVRVTGRAEAAPNRFHNLIRLQGASSIEAIALEEPRKLELAELIKASDTGHKVLECIPSVGSEYLLRGATGYARRDWGVALANFWIVVEQITSHLWGHIVIQGAKNDQPVTGRIDNLEDNRTWTISVRHEVLFQRGALPLAAFEELNSARKARNKLSHSGVHPDEGAARAALNSVRELFKTVFPDIDIPFLKLNLDDHGLSDPFRPKDTGPINPKYWMEIKKLPGERELEKLEANARTEGKNTSSF